MSWKEILRQILCRIYEIYGGDCAELGVVPDPAIPKVVEVGNGPLPVLDDQSRQALIEALNDLESHLATEGNDLTQKYNNMLVEMIAFIRAELGVQ